MKAASISTYIFALDSNWWRCSVDVWRLKKKNLQHGKNNTLLLLKEMIEKWYLITTKILELNTINIKGEMQFRKKKTNKFHPSVIFTNRASYIRIISTFFIFLPPFVITRICCNFLSFFYFMFIIIIIIFETFLFMRHIA